VLNLKKEVAERWKRGAEGAETNAEGVRIEAPRGRGMGRECTPPQPTRGSGERRELPQWGPGQSPGRKRIWCILWPL